MENLANWDKLAFPPKEALKTITGGRLNGKTDINPQWRIKAMTEVYGPYGVGWYDEIVELWTVPGTDGQVFAFARVNVYVKDGDSWGKPSHGIGGNMLIEKESKGLHDNDEAFKMAVTDALSVAMKFYGVGSHIYEGNNSGSKYPTNGKCAAHLEEPGDYVMPMGKTKGKKLSEIADKDLESAKKWIEKQRKENGDEKFMSELYEHLTRHLNGNIKV